MTTPRSHLLNNMDHWVALTADGQEHIESWGQLASPWYRLMEYCKHNKTYVVKLGFRGLGIHLELPQDQPGYWHVKALQGSWGGQELHASALGYWEPKGNMIKVVWFSRDSLGKAIWGEESRSAEGQQQLIIRLQK